MSKILKFIFFFTVIFQVSIIAQTSESPKDFREDERLEIKAYQTKGFPAFLENMKYSNS